MGTPSNTTKYRHKGTEKTHKSILYKGFILYVMIHGIYLRIEQAESNHRHADFQKERLIFLFN